VKIWSKILTKSKNFLVSVKVVAHNNGTYVTNCNYSSSFLVGFLQGFQYLFTM